LSQSPEANERANKTRPFWYFVKSISSEVSFLCPAITISENPLT
jgi:hypothetical protein